jgi:hypothetical protein
MVSSNKASFDLRERPPLSRNILHSCEMTAYGSTGQRMSPRISAISTGYRIRCISTELKVSADYLTYPADIRDTAKSGIGYHENRHLRCLAESIFVNVGGSHQNVKASSLPMSDESVGGVIVLGARESRVQGEGRQEKDAPLYLVTATAP